MTVIPLLSLNEAENQFADASAAPVAAAAAWARVPGVGASMSFTEGLCWQVPLIILIALVMPLGGWAVAAVIAARFVGYLEGSSEGRRT